MQPITSKALHARSPDGACRLQDLSEPSSCEAGDPGLLTQLHADTLVMHRRRSCCEASHRPASVCRAAAKPGDGVCAWMSSDCDCSRLGRGECRVGRADGHAGVMLAGAGGSAVVVAAGARLAGKGEGQGAAEARQGLCGHHLHTQPEGESWLETHECQPGNQPQLCSSSYA